MRKSIVFLLAIALAYSFFPSSSSAQMSLNWAQAYPMPYPYNTHTTTDQLGNIYIAAETTGGSYTLIKYNASGAYQWSATQSYGIPTVNIAPVGVGHDAVGNVYVATNTSTGIRVDAYSVAGSMLWSASQSYPQRSPLALVMTVDGSGNVFIGGVIYHSTQSTLYDYLTMRFSGGALRWMSTFSGSGNQEDQVGGIVADGLGNVFITGTAYNAHTYETITHTFNGKVIKQIVNDTTFDMTTIKYDSLGNLVWTGSYDAGRGINDLAQQIARDPSSGNIYVCGQSESSSSSTAKLVAYSPSGAQLWVAIDSSAPNVQGLAVDPSGNVIIATFTGSFGPGFKVSKYTAAGSLSWNYTNTTWPIVFNSTARNFPIALDQQGNCYLTGTSPNNGSIVSVEVAATGGLVWSATYTPGGSSGGQAIAVFTPRAILGQVAYPEITITGFSGASGYLTTLQYQYHQTVKDAERADSLSGGPTGMADPSSARISNFPNPFHGSTTIAYTLLHSSHVAVQVYDQTGKLLARVFEGDQDAGPHTLPFSSGRLAAGVYSYHIEAISPQGNFVQTKQMLIW